MYLYSKQFSRAVTTGEILTYCAASKQGGREKSWEKEITQLMKDFCFPKQTIAQVIQQTKDEAEKNETNKSMYQRAWKKFRNMLCT